MDWSSAVNGQYPPNLSRIPPTDIDQDTSSSNCSVDDRPPLSLLSSGATGAMWLTASQVIAQVIHVTIRVFLARLLLPSDFGLLAAAVTVISAMNLLLDLGFSAAIVQRRDLDRAAESTAFWLVLLSAVLGAMFLFGVAPLAALFYRIPEVRPVLQVLSVSLVLSAPESFFAALLQRDLRFRLLGVRRVLGAFVAGAVALTLALLGFGVWALVAHVLIQAVLGSIFLGIAVGRLPQMELSRTVLSEFWRFGRFVIAARAVNYLSRNADNLLCGRYLGASALGFYSFSYQAVLLPLQYFARPVASVSFPAISKIQDDLSRVRNAYERGLELIALPSTALAAIAGVTCDAWIPVIMGEIWLPTVPVFKVLSVVASLQALLTLNPPVLLALGKPKVSLYLTIFRTVFYVSGFAGGLSWGVTGVAVGYLIAVLITCPIQLMVVLRVLRADWRVLVGPTWTVTSTWLIFWLIWRLVRSQTLEIAPVLSFGLSFALLIVLFGAVSFLVNKGAWKNWFDVLQRIIHDRREKANVAG